METDKNVQQQNSGPNSAIGTRQIFALLGYYMVLLVSSVVFLVILIMDEEQIKPKLLLVVGYVASGALSGSVLYQIRMLYKYYIQHSNFDSKWLGKYITGPWEAIALALAVLSLIQGGGVVLGGSNFTLTAGNGFAAYGLGALIGFGIREVVGWLGNLAKATFPTEPKKSKSLGHDENAN